MSICIILSDYHLIQTKIIKLLWTRHDIQTQMNGKVSSKTGTNLKQF